MKSLILNFIVILIIAIPAAEAQLSSVLNTHDSLPNAVKNIPFDTNSNNNRLNRVIPVKQKTRGKIGRHMLVGGISGALSGALLGGSLQFLNNLGSYGVINDTSSLRNGAIIGLLSGATIGICISLSKPKKRKRINRFKPHF